MCVLALCASVWGFADEKVGLYADPSMGLPALRIEKVDMTVSISGTRAVTNLSFTFRNQTPELLEAEFVFPLDEGQSVYRLAYDILGKMREGSIVGASKGRQTFEQIVRENVDPALLEKEKGNRYSLKIYPVFPDAKRMVSIGVEQSLVYRDGAYEYKFPLEFSGFVEQFDLDLEVNGERTPTAVLGDSYIRFETSGPGYDATVSRTKLRAGQVLQVTIPKKREKRVRAFVEIDPSTGASYFFAEVPCTPSKTRSPKSVSIFWDTSLSSMDRLLAKEREFLFQYLNSLKLDQVELIPFSLYQQGAIDLGETATWPSALATSLDEMIYDGATRLSELDFSKASGDVILLFTDGMSSLGVKSPNTSSVPVFAINSIPFADHDTLQKICSDSGGQYLNLSRLLPQEALNALRRRAPEVTVEVESGTVRNLHTSFRSDSGGVVSLSGCLESADALIAMSFGEGGRKKRVEIKKSAAVEYTGAIQRGWARSHFERFDLLNPESKKQAREFAKNQRIVTSVTSLIVLETAGQYARFEVEPPRELRKAYDRHLAQRQRDAGASEQEEKLEDLVSRFEERIEWYETIFPKTRPQSLAETTELERQNPIAVERIEPPVSSPRVVESPVTNEDDEEVFELSSFTVNAEADSGYRATSTLAGSRLRSDLRDVAASSSIVEKSFLQDISLSDTESLQGSFGETEGSIEMANWSPDAPYYQELLAAADDELYPLYLCQRKVHGASVGYYFDAATVMFERGMNSKATLVLSNACESRPGDELFLRAVGRRCLQFASVDVAIDALEEALWLREFEPQSFFDLGLTYAADNRAQLAIETLYKILSMNLDYRFEEIDLIALMEINRIVAQSPVELDLSFMDKRLVYAMPMDLRIVLYWNTDDTDVDLWVTDPFGETCDYSHNLTATGGAMSEDITEGFGPEEFIIRKAIPGTYKIEVDYYGSSEQGVKLPPIVSVEVTRNFSRPSEDFQTITLRLEEVESTVEVGSVVVDEPVR